MSAYKEFNSESGSFISVQRQSKLNELCSNTLWLLVPSSAPLVSLRPPLSFSHPFLLPFIFLGRVCPGLGPSPRLNPCLAWLQHFLLMVSQCLPTAWPTKKRDRKGGKKHQQREWSEGDKERGRKRRRMRAHGGQEAGEEQILRENWRWCGNVFGNVLSKEWVTQ